MRLKALLLTAALIAAGGTLRGEACTRVVYEGDTTNTTSPSEVVRIVVRTLDWKTTIPTNLYVYPRGMRKKGHDKPGAVEWTSKYGAIYAVSYDGGITEGMNEMGLVVNALFCKGTVYNNEETAKLKKHAPFTPMY